MNQAISVKTLEAWEQGINTPGSAAARLLDLIGYDYGFAATIARQPLQEYDGAMVKAIRKKLGLPRELFALAIGVSFQEKLQGFLQRQRDPFYQAE